MIFFRTIILVYILTSLSACQKGSNGVKLPAKPTELEMKGKLVYLNNCIVCHNQNPILPGAVGPEIAGSSLELLTAGIMKVEYPEGYKPKRQSKLMVALPQLEKDIPALHAYLNSFKK